jgi:HlyD family secretion protein
MRLASRLAIGVFTLVAIAAAALAVGRGGSDPAVATAAASPDAPARVVGLGRVEPISEEIEVGVEVQGRVQALLVDEGDEVRAGQIIATLENRDYRAQVAMADARHAESLAVARRAHAGSRDEEIREARAAVAQAASTVEHATREAERRERLLEAAAIAREERDRFAHDVKVARTRLAEVEARQALVEAGPRLEDRQQADAAALAAAAALADARARLAKTEIRSPIDGTVLRRRVRVGETVSPELPNASLFSLADLRRLRVRVEVDEQDVARVTLGQDARITAPAYGARHFTGRVSRVGRVLGRKRIRTDEAQERIDTKVLEVLVDLDDGIALPVGLRVDVTLLRAGSS